MQSENWGVVLFVSFYLFGGGVEGDGGEGG